MRQTLVKPIKFLTVIWGERYVDEFARVALPSFMAPGNLPALAKGRDLEILIMTTRASQPVFERQQAFEKLKQIAPVRFIYIDDLVTSGNYGVTLTYAYARGVMDSGDAQTNTTFVFMNADFVLADGSLGHLRQKIETGHPCIMSASLRARSEPVLPRLIEAVDPKTGLLVMPPRPMVDIAMGALHPTVIGKTVSQNLMSCSTNNQFYWQVDETTLLGRYHLIFMLSISPESPLTKVNSYCDYGFVPEMVPSGKFHVIGDSDEFFMLELAPTHQEREFLYCGKTPMSEIASALSLWTTKEHRKFATADTVFHSRDLPPGLSKVRQQAEDFVSRLQSMMRRDPVTHVDHYYWVSGVASWNSIRENARLKEEEETLKAAEAARANEAGGKVDGAAAAQTLNGPVGEPSLPVDGRSQNAERGPRRPLSLGEIMQNFFTSLLLMGRRARGVRPDVAIWHDLWLDCRLALSWVRRVTAKASFKNLVVGQTGDPLPAVITRRSRSQFLSTDDLLVTKAGAYDNIFLHVFRKDVLRSAPLIEHALSRLAPGGELALFVEHSNADTDQSNFTAELAQYAPDILPRGWMGINIRARFVGGRAKRHLRQLERLILPQIIPSRPRYLPLSLLAITAWSVMAGLTAVNNLIERTLGRWNPDRRPAFSSAALILFALRPALAQTRDATVDTASACVVSLPATRRAVE